MLAGQTGKTNDLRDDQQQQRQPPTLNMLTSFFLFIRATGEAQVEDEKTHTNT